MFTLDTLSHTCFVDGQTIQLTPGEYRLLSILLKARNRNVDSSLLSIEVFGDVDIAKLDNLIRRIRRKTGITIEKVRGIGYRLPLP